MKLINKKNIFLIVIIVITFLVFFFFGVKPTLRISNSYEQLSIDAKNYSSSLNRLQILKAKNKNYDSLLNQKISKKNGQQKLLEFLTSKTDEKPLKINEFKEPHIFKNKEGLLIKSFQFIIESNSYKSLENLLYTLEQQNIGVVSHVKIYTKRNSTKNKKLLFMFIILQQYLLDY